jgi:alpha-L-fucosidase
MSADRMIAERAGIKPTHVLIRFSMLLVSRLILILSLIDLCVPRAFSATAAATAPSGQSAVRPYDTAQQKRLAWFTQARLGLFIHWGLYAIPAGHWPGRESKNQGEWIMLQENIPSADYEKLATVFNPVKFDAKAWVAVAKAAGMKYLVITAKHHDGFSMFASKVSHYNIVEATPFKRDPLKELAAACREAGIVFCVYYSVADWHHPEFPANYSQAARNLPPWDSVPRGFHGAPNPTADLAKYADYMREQVAELLTNYGDIGIVWFDGGGAVRVPNRGELIKGDELVATIRHLQPNTLINNRAGVLADYGTPEQRIPGGRTVEPFEVCMTLNRHWGYNAADHDWKTPGQIVRNIADIVSKGGNYLLNVGPTAEGEIPADSVRILTEVGKWTQAHGEAVYGAGPTPFGDELGYEDSTKTDKEGRPLWVDREAWRCTTKPGKLFFTLLEWPGASFALPKFSNRIKAVYWLGDRSRAALRVEGEQDARRVILPDVAPEGLAPVLCVEIEGEVSHQSAKRVVDAKKDDAS